MNTYLWEGRTNRGDLQKGMETALSVDDLASALSERGVVPLSIQLKQDRGETLAFVQGLFTRPRLVSPELMLLCRQMATITKAGVPLLRGVRGVAVGITDQGLRDALIAIASSLEGGASLASSLARFPSQFSNLFVTLVRVGEAGGQLDLCFRELERHMKRELSTIKKLKSAVRYPTFVAVAMVVAMVVINFTVIPAFSNVFARFGTDLPLLTQVLVFFSDLTVKYWGLWIVLGIAGFFGVRVFLSTSQGQMLWGRWKLKIPIMGSLFVCASLERYTRSFSMLFRAGVPLTELVTLCAVIMDNPYLQSRIERIREGLENGESFVSAHERAQFFPPLVVQMLSVGEETGQLDELLDEVSYYYEAELDYDLEKLAARIEPILIVGLAGLVVVLALGIFLPIWDLYGLQLRG
jgi:MSHA biogenesis protein MshG